MIDYALKNLKSRKTRTTLCILSVTICVLLIGNVDGMLSQMREGFLGELSGYMGKISVQQMGSGYPPFNSSIDNEMAFEILKTQKINTEESTPLLMVVLAPANNPMDVAEVYGVGIVPGKENAYLQNTKAKEGVTHFQESNSIILGERAAKYFDVSVDEKIEIAGETATVVGIFELTNQSSIDQVVLMPLSFAQKAFARENTVTSVLLTAKDAREVESVAAEMRNLYPKLEIVTQKQVKEKIDQIMEMPNKFMGMISATVFVVAIVVIMNVMVMAIMERRHEIGILRAIGTKNKSILETILTETLVLCIFGGILGLILTILVAYIQDWTWILSNKEMMKIAFLIIVIGTLSGLYPAYKATKIDPIVAIRYE